MFECIHCTKRYLLEDVEEGRFFPSTSSCLTCYKKMYKNAKLCFGDKEKHNMKTLPCQECPDNRICRTMVWHRKEFSRKGV